jgi:hypothetical protein
MVLIDPHYIWFFLIGIFLIVLYSSYIQSIPRTNTKETFDESIDTSVEYEATTKVESTGKTKESTESKKNDQPDEILNISESSQNVSKEPNAITPNETVWTTNPLPRKLYYIEDGLPGDSKGFTLLEEQFNSIVPTTINKPRKIAKNL